MAREFDSPTQHSEIPFHVDARGYVQPMLFTKSQLDNLWHSIIQTLLTFTLHFAEKIFYQCQSYSFFWFINMFEVNLLRNLVTEIQSESSSANLLYKWFKIFLNFLFYVFNFFSLLMVFCAFYG